MIEVIVFAACAVIVLVGAVGVVLAHNPVHSALFLIQTLFGIAVLFIALEAHFLAAVQIVVYAGAIVILFLFVIMLLGVDQVEDLGVEPIVGQRFFAGLVGLGVFFLVTASLVSSEGSITGAPSTT
ncbi:MAG: NADH-quinone oxidoreductase subunit J, partial [Acidimicrobiales bacterium]